jgi:hypothetical protein
MKTSITAALAVFAALSPLASRADDISSFWESISVNGSYAESPIVETPRAAQIEKKYGLVMPIAGKNPKTGKETWIFFRQGPSSGVFPVVVPKDATDEQVEIACQAALAVTEDIDSGVRSLLDLARVGN